MPTFLDDRPDGILEGEGKPLRHIKLRSVDEVGRLAVKKQLAAASKHLPKLKPQHLSGLGSSSGFHAISGAFTGLVVMG